jgi:hypothetical protein
LEDAPAFYPACGQPGQTGRTHAVHVHRRSVGR